MGRCKIMKQNRMERGFVIFGKIMLVAAIFLNAWITWKYYFYFVTADDASELVLARMLARDGGILSANWYYSTELRILNTQLIYSLLFRFLTNFKVIRILGQVILTVIFLASYYFCLCSIDSKLAGNRFWKTAFLLVLPIGWPWLFLIMKTYYIPHVAITFLALGMACQMQKEDTEDRKKLILLICGGLLAFVAGLEGIRHIQLAYLPLILSSVWLWWNALEDTGWSLKDFRIPKGSFANLCWFLCAAAGYLVNTKVLSKVYFFKSYDEQKFTEILGMENIQNSLNGFLEVTGYTGEKEMLSAGGLCNAIAVVFLCFMLLFLLSIVINMKKYEQEDQLILSFLVLSFGLTMFICTSLNSVVSRWIMACVAPMVLLFMFLEGYPAMKRYVLLGGFYCIALLLGSNTYYEIKADHENDSIRNVYEFITENDYSYGYSTFWAGNLLTELTNGEFETRCVRGDYENNKLILFQWLMPIEAEYQEGPILCILQKRRVEDLPLPENWSLMMEDEEYLIYEVPDHREMEEYLVKRN